MAILSHKERFLRAINHEEADRVPTYAFKCEMGFLSTFDETFDVREESWVHFGQDQTVLVELGIDATTEPGLGDRPDPAFGFRSYQTPEGYTVGANGRITLTASDGRNYYQGGAWTSPEEREKFPERVPPPQEEFDRFEKFYRQKIINEDKIYVFPIINGLHEGNWLSMGYSAYAKELRKPTGFLDDLLDDLHKANIEICKRLLDIDDEMVIAFTDDIAQKGRLMVAPKYFAKYYAPRYKSLFNMIHKRGGRTMFHTDGDISDLLPLYVDIGLDLLQGLEPIAGVDIITLNEQYGDKIAWNGNIDVSRLLWKGTPAEVRAESERVIKSVAPSNNLVFGPSTDIMAFHPIENILAMYDAALAFDLKSRSFNYARVQRTLRRN